jgi:hypothetical protein
VFNTPGVERFVYLNDGRKLFLPRGPGGPVYLVPDLETHLRLERRYDLVDRVVKFALGVGLLAASLVRFWMLVPVLILVGLVLPRWADRGAVESLPEVHDHDALRAARRRHEPSGRWGRLGGVAAGIGVLTFATYLGRTSGGLTGEVAALYAAGLVMLVTALSSLGESRPDELSRGYIDPPHGPIVPK